MHSALPLPHVPLTAAQRRLLARLAEGPVPDPSDRLAFVQALAVSGLDADQARDDLPDLRWMKVITLTDGMVVLTELGAAFHFRALFEAAEERLGEVARLAELRETVAPRFAHAVRRLADGSYSLTEALAAVDDE